MRRRMPLRPWTIGEADVPGPVLARRTRRLMIAAIASANAVGAAVVLCFAIYALPTPEDADTVTTLVVNVAAAVTYIAFALVVGVVWGRRRVEGAWLQEGRDPDRSERQLVLQAPLRIMLVEATLWGLAVVLFAAINAVFDWLLALGVGLTVAFGGITTSAAAYLMAELAQRPVAARALAAGPVDRRWVPGLTLRWALAWGLGTGVPVLGLLLIGIVAVTPVDIGETTLAITTMALCSIALVFGAIVSFLAAYATVHPIRTIRHGLDRVRQGDLDTRVAVWDSTEIGLLQAGFNEMVAGLRDRERLRDLFGRHVGEDVARQALEGEFELGGEVRHVAVLFVDVVGSTALAADRPPQDVVALLNRFFADVVDVVEDCGGWINKFEGDAALAIFGAPIGIRSPETCALRAARKLDARLRDADLGAGIGVAAGEAVAGHIGAEHRYEYTVIGDPVNEAARLTELAKEHAPRVLASAPTVEAATDDEARRWELRDEVTLRGRPTPTRLAAPA